MNVIKMRKSLVICLLLSMASPSTLTADDKENLKAALAIISGLGGILSVGTLATTGMIAQSAQQVTTQLKGAQSATVDGELARESAASTAHDNLAWAYSGLAAGSIELAALIAAFTTVLYAYHHEDIESPKIAACSFAIVAAMMTLARTAMVGFTASSVDALCDKDCALAERDSKQLSALKDRAKEGSKAWGSLTTFALLNYIAMGVVAGWLLVL